MIINLNNTIIHVGCVCNLMVLKMKTYLSKSMRKVRDFNYLLKIYKNNKDKTA